MNRLDVLCIGFGTEFDHIAQVTALPKPGCSSILTGSFKDLVRGYYGGVSENIAVTTAKLGLKTACIAAVGNEFEPKGYKEYLLERGINIEGLIIRNKETSGHCILLFDAQGRDVKISAPGTAIKGLDRFEPSPSLIERSKCLIFSAVDRGGYSLKAAVIATKKNIPVYLSGPLSKLEASVVRRWLELIDIWILNEFEVNVLCQKMSLNNRREILELGSSSIIVTKGKEGSYIYTKNRIKAVHVSAVPPKRMVCPIGCGDAFAGGVAAGLARGYDIITATKIGATVSSFILEEMGCQRGQPSWEEMKKRYKKYFRGDL